MKDGSALEDMEEEDVNRKCATELVREVTLLIEVDVPVMVNEEVNVIHSLSAS